MLSVPPLVQDQKSQVDYSRIVNNNHLWITKNLTIIKFSVLPPLKVEIVACNDGRLSLQEIEPATAVRTQQGKDRFHILGILFCFKGPFNSTAILKQYKRSILEEIHILISFDTELAVVH